MLVSVNIDTNNVIDISDIWIDTPIDLVFYYYYYYCDY